METIATLATGYLIKAIKENKDLSNLGNDFLSATIHWIRPLFLKDEAPKALQNLQTNPDDPTTQKAVTKIIEQHITQNPTQLTELTALLKSLKEANIHPAPIGNTINNYGNIEKQVNNPIINGNLNM